MTQGHESGVRPNPGAERLLEYLAESILQEAAVRRNDPAGEISSLDIVATLESRRKLSRRRDRGAFAVQVLGTAIALSGAVTVLSTGLLALRNWQTGAVQPGPFFTTVLLAILAVVAVTLLMFRIGDISDGFRSRLLRGSRYEEELELLRSWEIFEESMRRSVEEVDANNKRPDLSTVILKFADRYGVDPQQVKTVLRVRNAVAHRTSKVSAREVRVRLDELRKLREVLEVSEEGIR
ncbi:MAG: hypothetical protein ACRDRA_04010 [Pseudonocardiaceae bacterium]